MTRDDGRPSVTIRADEGAAQVSVRAAQRERVLVQGQPPVSIVARAGASGGIPGPQGPPGPASRWSAFPGPPGPMCGDYDFHLDTATGDVWACGSQVARNGRGRYVLTRLV